MKQIHDQNFQFVVRCVSYVEQDGLVKAGKLDFNSRGKQYLHTGPGMRMCFDIHNPAYAVLPFLNDSGLQSKNPATVMVLDISTGTILRSWGANWLVRNTSFHVVKVDNRECAYI